MFGWLRGLFRREDAFDLYRPKDRLIYSYFDGQRVVKADPMVLHKRLMEVGPDLSVEMKVAASESKDAATYHGKLIERIRKIFDVKTLTEGGLGEVETTELLDHFLTYCGRIKKKDSPPPTSPGATSPPSASSPVANPATPSSSPSGSTANASPNVSPAS